MFLAQLVLFIAIISTVVTFTGLRWVYDSVEDKIYDLIERKSDYSRDRVSFGHARPSWKDFRIGLLLPELRIDGHEFGDIGIFFDPFRLLTGADKALVKIELKDFSGEILFDQTGGLNFKGLQLQPNLGLGNMHQGDAPWLALNLLEIDQEIELRELRVLDPSNNFSAALSDGTFRFDADDARLRAQAKLVTDWGVEAEFDMDLAKRQTGLVGYFGLEVSALDLAEIPTPFLSAFKVQPSGTLDKARLRIALDDRGNARADINFPASSKILLRHRETGYSSDLEVVAINFNARRQRGGLLLSSELRLAADANSSMPPKINGELFFVTGGAGSGSAPDTEQPPGDETSEPLRQLGMSLLLPYIDNLEPGPAKISGQNISLPAMQQLARTILPALEQRLRGLGAISLRQGFLRHWQLQFDEQRDPDWSFNGSIDGISAAIDGPHPGMIEDISAQLRIEPNRGRVFVNADAVRIDFPTVFDRPLPALAIRGLIELDVGADAVSFTAEIPFWELHSLDASADIRGQLRFHPEQGLEVDLNGEFQLPDLAILESFYPYRAVPEGLAEWLHDAEIRGRADNGTLVMRGPMRSFPFERGPGELRLDADVILERIHYTEGWPLLRDAYGKFSISDGGVQLALPQGFSHITEAPDASGGNADPQSPKTRVRDILIEVDRILGPTHIMRGSMTAAGDISELLGFARRGPLSEELGPFVQDAVGRGPVEAVIEDLTVPLHDPDRLRVRGHLNLAETRVESKNLLLKVDDIDGRIDFTRYDYRAKDLRMRIFGNDFKVNASSDDKARRKGQTRIEIVAEGLADPAVILKNYALPGWHRLSGKTAWRAVFDVVKKPADASPRVRLVATSDLRGVKVNLPAPLAKTVFRGIPLRLDLLLENAGEERALEVQYGDLLSLRMVHDPDNININRGHARFGPAPISKLGLPQGRIFRVTGSMKELDVDGWLDFIDEVQAQPTPPVRPPQVPAQINTWPYSAENLRAEHIEYLGFKWRGLKADIKTRGNYYHGTFSSEQAGGSADVPRSPDLGLPVFARLEYLDFDDLESVGEEAEPLGEVPPLDVKIDELVFQSAFIENLDVNLVPVNGGMETRRFSFSNKGLKARGQASWRRASRRAARATHDTSKVSINLDYTDLGRAWYGLTGDGDVFEGGSGNSKVELSWDHSLFDPEFSEITGDLSFNASDGRLLIINPVAAKALNLLLVTQWFKGLDAAAGLLYSKIEAKMKLRDSSLHQERTRITSDLALIDIQGKTNVVEETLDLKAFVNPPISAALPAGGYLLGGVPGLLGGLLLQGLTNLLSDDDERSGLLYDVGGTWDEPLFVLSDPSESEAPRRQP